MRNIGDIELRSRLSKNIYELQLDRSTSDCFTVKSDRSIKSHPDNYTKRTPSSLFIYFPFSLLTRNSSLFRRRKTRPSPPQAQYTVCSRHGVRKTGLRQQDYEPQRPFPACVAYSDKR